MIFRILVAAYFFCWFNAQSQSSVSGFYVTITRDTIRGACIPSTISSTRVRFNTSSRKKIELTPDSTLCVTCGNLKLFGANVDVEVSADIVDDMDSLPSLNLEKRHIFLKQAKTGDKQLYWFMDKHKREQIYVKENDKFILLRYKRYKWYPNKTEIFLIENTEFRSQLAAYLINCKKVNSQLQHTTYTVNSIAKLFDYFSECSRERRK
ncbi:MAG: hypothetical protein ACKO96_32490 [Flammeovirgaceae bacterium]